MAILAVIYSDHLKNCHVINALKTFNRLNGSAHLLQFQRARRTDAAFKRLIIDVANDTILFHRAANLIVTPWVMPPPPLQLAHEYNDAVRTN